MADLLELAERCEAATGPDRELDFFIARNTGWSNKCDARWGIASPHWWRNGKCITEMVWHYGPSGAYLPAFTASLDAAMTLVPEGMGLRIDRYWIASADGPVWSAQLVTGGLPDKPRQAFETWDHATPALALCAAALRAREQS